MILILGKGKTGKSFIKYCEKRQLEYIVYTDEDKIDNYNNIDKIFASPGFPRWHNIFSCFPNIPVYSDFNLIEDYVKDKYVIGITGTKGKSTICSMLYHILYKSGHVVSIAGNIGIPVLDLDFTSDIYIFEISSNQLEYIDIFPYDISVIVNLSHDHLNRYRNIDEYYQYKMKIFSSSKYNVLRLARGFNIPDMTNIQLVEYILNYIPFKTDINHLHTFQHLEHRLEQFKYKDINIINDSCATNSIAAKYALSKFNADETVWLVGGLPKEDIQWIIDYEYKNKIIFGSIGNISCKEAIYQAVQMILHDKKIKNILFSPACASFDEFNNVYERGIFFKKEVICILEKYI